MNQDNNNLMPTNTNQNVNPLNPGVSVQPQVAQAQVVAQTQVAVQPQATVQPQTEGQPQATPTATPQVTINPLVYICPKCGSEVRKDSRYCMKCGNLNYSHPDNESMKKYAWQSIKQGHFISGANLDEKQKDSVPVSSSVSKAHPFRACVITNIILHLLVAILDFICLAAIAKLIGMKIPIYAFIVPLISASILFFCNYTIQAMYIKAGEPWWAHFVPFYGTYVFYKISMGNGWLFLTLVVPILGFVINAMAFYNLGKNFYKNGWLMIFFPYVMIPIIAFDKNTEYSLLAQSNENNTTVTVNAKTKTASEKEYGRNKFFITLIVVVVLAVILYFAWPYLVPILEKLYKIIMEQIGTIK